MSLGDALQKLSKKPRWKRRPEILLSDNIPQPMHGTAPRVILGSKWWNATRKAAYASTDFHCIACGVHKTMAKGRKWLEGHELYKVDYPKGRLTYLETVPLCHFCHNFIHDGRLLSLLHKEEIHHQKFVAIIQHGDRVLASVGLKRKPREKREAEYTDGLLMNTVAAWKDWRLVIDNLEYMPKFRTAQQWKKAMQ